MRFVIFGAGLQGRVIARNLASRAATHEVVLADARPPEPGGGPKVRVVRLDARDPEAVASVARGAVAVTALPGEAGSAAVANLIRCGSPTVDIGFTPDPPLEHDAAARAAGVPVVVDCGVAPGLSHVLAGEAVRKLGDVSRLDIHVGGMPLRPPPGFLHAVYFNARDLLSEYVRPARLRRAGRDVAPDPLVEPAIALYDEECGPLEAFASDGLRSLLRSFPAIPEMGEYTLRVPGHLAAMRTLRGLRLLDESPVEGLAGAPIDATARVLGARFPGSEHPDRLLMEVHAEGNGSRLSWRLHDVRDVATGESAMSRTTGFTAAAVAVALAEGRFTAPGVHPPEALGLEGHAEALLSDLAAQGVVCAAERRLHPQATRNARD